MIPLADRACEDFIRLRPSGGFRVILADPPWSYENFSAAGEAKNAKAHYGCLPTAEMLKIPVGLLAAKDCALFIWCTWPLMPVWDPVIAGWGFRFAGLAWEWLKFNPVTGKYAFGPGYGARKNLEPCLLATRGNPRLRGASEFFGRTDIPEGVHSVRDFIEAMPLDAIRAPRRQHSRKPDEQYDRIETLFDGPYIELFARQRRHGWEAWGDQTGKFGEENR